MGLKIEGADQLLAAIRGWLKERRKGLAWLFGGRYWERRYQRELRENTRVWVRLIVTQATVRGTVDAFRNAERMLGEAGEFVKHAVPRSVVALVEISEARAHCARLASDAAEREHACEEARRSIGLAPHARIDGGRNAGFYPGQINGEDNNGTS